MRALADAVHARGLKLGIYSSPGPKTCEEFEGSWQHEAQDAATYAAWGVDFLKYDWCSYEELIRGDHSLVEIAEALHRDARCAGASRSRHRLCAVPVRLRRRVEVGRRSRRAPVAQQRRLAGSVGQSRKRRLPASGRERWTRPGEWNDTDMLVVGTLGWGPNLRPSRLTPNEQVLHLSLWALQAAPLFIGADLSKLDTFTLSLLSNDEVIAVDQDSARSRGGRVWSDARREIWARPLADGTMAVGLFNRGLHPAEVTVQWQQLGLQGRQPVRDLWQRRDLGVLQEKFTATVPRHGAVLLKVGKPR
jgi:alpha-galactosidase